MGRYGWGLYGASRIIPKTCGGLGGFLRGNDPEVPRGSFREGIVHYLGDDVVIGLWLGDAGPGLRWGKSRGWGALGIDCVRRRRSINHQYSRYLTPRLSLSNLIGFLTSFTLPSPGTLTSVSTYSLTYSSLTRSDTS